LDWKGIPASNRAPEMNHNPNQYLQVLILNVNTKDRQRELTDGNGRLARNGKNVVE